MGFEGIRSAFIKFHWISRDFTQRHIRDLSDFKGSLLGNISVISGTSWELKVISLVGISAF